MTNTMKLPPAVERSNNYGKIGTKISNTTTATTVPTLSANRSSGSVGSHDGISIVSTYTSGGCFIASSQASVSSVSISSGTLSSVTTSSSSSPVTTLRNLLSSNEVITESMEDCTLNHAQPIQPIGTVLSSTLSNHPKRVRVSSDGTITTHDTTATATTLTTIASQETLGKQRPRNDYNKLVDDEVSTSRSVTSTDESLANPASTANSKVSFVPSSIVTTDVTPVVEDAIAYAAEDTVAPIRPRDPAMELKDELYKYMREEPGMFDWIQEALGDGVWYYNMADAVWYSPAYKALFGYADDEVPNVATWWQEHIFPEDLVTSMQGFQKHIECGTPYDQIVRYRHKDGSTVWVRCHGKAIFNEDGIPIRMLGAHNDLTELMKVQEKLREKEAILHLLCTTSLDGYWDWDMTTGDLQMSTRFKNLLGYEEEDLPNRMETWWSLLHPDDVPKLQEAIANCTVDDDQTPLNDEKPPLLNIVLRYRRKNGTIARMLAQGVAQSRTIQSLTTPSSSSEATAAAVPTKQWIRMFGTHTDVSYLEEARAARDANAAKTTFLATMSHEIRTPLNAVLGMAEVLMTTSLTEEQKDCVTTLHNSGAHLLSLINDILDFSQIEAGIISLTNEEVDIQCTVRNVLDVLQLSAQQKDVVLSFETTIPANAQFYGDSERIRQIVFNVLGNAVKFTSFGSVHTSIQPRTIGTCNVDGSTNNDNYGVEIVITDTGCGIAPDQISCIFEDFRQAGHEIRSKYGGSGLGLSICKKLIQAMGGTITVESALGQGSTFTVWLPGLSTKNVSSGQPQTQNQPGSKEPAEKCLPSSIHPSVREENGQPTPSLQSPNLQNAHPVTLQANGQQVLERTTLQQPQNESKALDTTVEPIQQQPTKLYQVTDEPAIASSKSENLRTMDHLEEDATTTMDRTSFRLQSFEIELPKIYLYEELVRERGRVKGGLIAAGMKVYPVRNASEVIHYISNSNQNQSTLAPLHAKVVLHNQGRHVSDKVQTFVTDLLKFYNDASKENKTNIRLHLYDVGRKVGCTIPDKYKSMYTSLPCFPTSDELYQDILGEEQNHLSMTSLFRPNLRRPLDGAANGGGSFMEKIVGESESSRSDASNLPSSATNRLGSRRGGSTTIAGTDKAGGCGDRTLKILVAEDNIINQKVLRRLLSRFACEMEVANNGLEAVERARNEQWDLIFMDLIMPEMDGLEAAKIIRQTDTVTPIVALTANATTDDRDGCFEAGMNDFITKPVSMDALRKLLHKICSNVALSNPI